MQKMPWRVRGTEICPVPIPPQHFVVPGSGVGINCGDELLGDGDPLRRLA